MGHADSVIPVLTAGAAGVVAGLGVAIPLGAVSVLLLSEAMTRGWRAGAAAASGVATVDLVYVAAATVAGAAVASALAGREAAVRLAASAFLALVAVRGLLSARAGGVEIRPPDAVRVGTARPRPYWRFVVITAVNPLTALYFLALSAGLGDRLAGTARLSAFVAGVGVGSLAWQLLLAAVGARAGRAVGPRGRMWAAVAGNVTVLILAFTVALGPAVAGS